MKFFIHTIVAMVMLLPFLKAEAAVELRSAQDLEAEISIGDFLGLDVAIQAQPDHGRYDGDRCRRYGDCDRRGDDRGRDDRGRGDHDRGRDDERCRRYGDCDYRRPGRGAVYTCFAENRRGDLFRARDYSPRFAQAEAMRDCLRYSRFCRELGCQIR